MIKKRKMADLNAELAGIIKKNNDFLIITHTFPDGDALGSLTAFHGLVSSLGKYSRMVCNSDLPYQYRFLPGFEDIKRDHQTADIFDRKYICIILDCADSHRTGIDMDRLKAKGSYVVNIDHHRSNNNFGDLNIVDSDKSATSEMLFEFMQQNFAGSLDYDIAIGIYVGILTDTGRFQYSNTTANVHRITGKLLEYGIQPSDVYGYIYESDPLGRFRLIRVVLDRVKYIEELSLVYSYVLEKDLTRLNIPFYSQDGIIELLRSAEAARVTVLVKQIGKASYKVSLRTSDSKIDLSRIAAGFGGGGHRTASAYQDEGSLRDVIARLKDAVRKEIEG